MVELRRLRINAIAVVHVLRHVPDDERIFPSGKWATIQRRKVSECAKLRT